MRVFAYNLFKITTKNLQNGVEQAYWPGRLHKIFLNLPEKNFIDVKIWLDGTVENSAKRMQNRDNVGESLALDVVKKRFNENKIIYKNLYNFEFGDDLSVFDKIIETDGKNAEQVLEIAKSNVRELL